VRHRLSTGIDEINSEVAVPNQSIEQPSLGGDTADRGEPPASDPERVYP
jgi:hypothetical protein